jgi:hypothetical protein
VIHLPVAVGRSLKAKRPLSQNADRVMIKPIKLYTKSRLEISTDQMLLNGIRRT